MLPVKCVSGRSTSPLVDFNGPCKAGMSAEARETSNNVPLAGKSNVLVAAFRARATPLRSVPSFLSLQATSSHRFAYQLPCCEGRMVAFRAAKSDSETSRPFGTIGHSANTSPTKVRIYTVNAVQEERCPQSAPSAKATGTCKSCGHTNCCSGSRPGGSDDDALHNTHNKAVNHCRIRGGRNGERHTTWPIDALETRTAGLGTTRRHDGPTEDETGRQRWERSRYHATLRTRAGACATERTNELKLQRVLIFKNVITWRTVLH
jgi:hypothetical protein